MAARNLEIVEEIQNDINIYRLCGQLDSNSSEELEQRLFQAISNGTKNLVLNFNGLHYISSAGIRSVLNAVKAIKRIDGCITLCCLQDHVKEIFDICGMGVMLSITSTVDDALVAF